MKRIFLAACLAVCLCLPGTGCVTTTVEDDGVPVGPRGGFFLLNPAAHPLNDLDVQVEAAYGKILDAASTSGVICGYGGDTGGGGKNTVYYLLATGRYYPAKTAPAGFFLSADVGAGRYTYGRSGNTEVNFIYGLALGYAFLYEGFILEAGAGGLRMNLVEDTRDFIPVLRVQFGRRF